MLVFVTLLDSRMQQTPQGQTSLLDDLSVVRGWSASRPALFLAHEAHRRQRRRENKNRT